MVALRRVSRAVAMCDIAFMDPGYPQVQQQTQTTSDRSVADVAVIACSERYAAEDCHCTLAVPTTTS